MATIQWKDSMCIGHEVIDQQHRAWVDIFNTMNASFLGGSYEQRASSGAKALNDMMEYANVHFDFEEEYMNSINYPDAARHARLHKEFTEKIHQYAREISSGSFLFNNEVLRMIKTWLINHILIEDKKISEFLLAKNNSDPE